MILTPEERDFLERLKANRKLPHADNEQDRIRQRVRLAGLAEVKRQPRRWVITEKGLSVLSNQPVDKAAAMASR